jgi:hypothetical protein
VVWVVCAFTLNTVSATAMLKKILFIMFNFLMVK